MPYFISSRQAAVRTMWVTRQTRLQNVNCWWPEKARDFSDDSFFQSL